VIAIVEAEPQSGLVVELGQHDVRVVGELVERVPQRPVATNCAVRDGVEANHGLDELEHRSLDRERKLVGAHAHPARYEPRLVVIERLPVA